MSDALSSFLSGLMSTGTVTHISIVSDNAKRIESEYRTTGEGRRRSAPGRSVSTPLSHMSSRWESPSKFDFKSIHPSTDGTNAPASERRHSGDLKIPSRWDHEAAKRNSDGLRRPSRTSARKPPNSIHDSSGMLKMRDTMKASSFYDYTKTDLTSSSLPKSLRSLPY